MVIRRTLRNLASALVLSSALIGCSSADSVSDVDKDLVPETLGLTYFSAVEDAYVQAQAPQTNFGTEPTVAAANTQWTYFKFQVSGLGKVHSAKLKLWRTQGDAPVGPRIYVADPQWSESSLVWDNRPGLGAFVSASPALPAPGLEFVELDVTQAVTGDGVVSLVFAGQTEAPVFFGSRESLKASERPQLIVEHTKGSATAPPEEEETPQPPPPGGVNNPPNEDGTEQGDAWNGLTTFNVANATRGAYPDSRVYWAIIGKSWETGEFVHVTADGSLVPMKISDNGALVKNGVGYSNYFFTLEEKKSITIPAINSARILFSVGEPMYVRVVLDGNGKVAYAGANIQNPADPNIDVHFDFGEMAILPKGHSNQGIFVNTSRVDQFGFPLKLHVKGLGGYDKTVGEPLTETRDELFQKFLAETPAEFASLAQAPQAPYRIAAPAHATFKEGGVNANYLQPYIDEMWNRFRNEDLVFTLQNLGTFRGRITGDVFRFTGGKDNGTFFINGKPSTSMALLGNGFLDDTSGGPSNAGTQLQIQAQVCAALNRRVLEQPANWHNSAAFYPEGKAANWFAKFFHDHSLWGRAYGFAYDDVGDFSPSLHTNAPTEVTFSIGW